MYPGKNRMDYRANKSELRKEKNKTVYGLSGVENTISKNRIGNFHNLIL